jgi:oligoendopeptidase F
MKDKAIKTAQELAGRAWSLDAEYASVSAPEYLADRSELSHAIDRLRSEATRLKPAMALYIVADSPNALERPALLKDLQAASSVINRIRILLANLSTYVNCLQCIDDTSEPVSRAQSELTQLQSDFETAGKPLWLFLDRVPESFVVDYLSTSETAIEEFTLRQSRVLSGTLLSEREEIMLTRFKTHGPILWGDLYAQIASGMKCKVMLPNNEIEEIGLAQALGRLRDSSESTRHAAWIAIQSGWGKHKNTCASILNGLAGWRLEELALRDSASGKKSSFLDLPLHLARIRPETLEAMLSTVSSNIELPRRAMRALAQGLGKQQLDPWDLIASAPTEADSRRSFAESIELIASAFSGVDPAMGAFVRMMDQNGWIEGRVLSGKRQGAFCTRFAKSGAPRVFQTFMGSIPDLRTLAHELGHAYHFWLMRDLPVVLHRSPMTLMESASIFGETAFAEAMCKNGDVNVNRQISWQNAEAAATYLLNMPARYDFERAFYERRQKGSVSAEELGDLTAASWGKWYGDTLSAPDRLFWATKLHFSLPWISFYNYPYTFGYLFSLRLFAMFKAEGASFLPRFHALLRDTGRMTAEELAVKHLGEDISQPAFWEGALQIVNSHVTQFETFSSVKKNRKSA